MRPDDDEEDWDGMEDYDVTTPNNDYCPSHDWSDDEEEEMGNAINYDDDEDVEND
jgi:hypothetical protein